MHRLALVASLLAITSIAHAADPVLPQSSRYETDDAWRQPIAPFQLADHTWYIGTQGLSALLIRTPEGALLIDGGLAAGGGHAAAADARPCACNRRNSS
jgi:metallo-beta-lactamase class B